MTYRELTEDLISDFEQELKKKGFDGALIPPIHQMVGKPKGKIFLIGKIKYIVNDANNNTEFIFKYFELHPIKGASDKMVRAVRTNSNRYPDNWHIGVYDIKTYDEYME